MSLAIDIADRLHSLGIATKAATLFVGSGSAPPDGDGPYLTVIETGGFTPERIQNQTAAAYRRPSAQILARGKSYVATNTMIHAAFLALDGVFNTTLSGTRYISLTARQEPVDLGLDDVGRVRLAFNVDSEKHP